MNKVTLEPTKFENVRTGQITFGWRAYDDRGQCYNNTMESIPDDDLELLKEAISDDNEEFQSMIHFIFEHETGIYIGGNWYSHDEIKDII